MFFECMHVLFGIFLCCPAFYSFNVIFFQHLILCTPFPHCSTIWSCTWIGNTWWLVNSMQECKISFIISIIFILAKIGGHKCGYNQFWYSLFFILCFDGLLLSTFFLKKNCSLKSLTFCCFLGLSIRTIFLSIQWMTLHGYYDPFLFLQALFP